MVSVTILLTNLLLLRGAALARSHADSDGSAAALREPGRFPPQSANFAIDQLHVTLKRFPQPEIPYVIRSTGQPAFKNGAFEFNKRVLNRLRSTDRELARRLVSVAPKATMPPMPELLRRQDGGNATTTPVTSISTVIQTSRASTTVVETTSIESPTTSPRAPSTPKPPVTVDNPPPPSSSPEFPPTTKAPPPSSIPEPTSSTSSSTEDESPETTNGETRAPKPTSKFVYQTTTLANGDKSTLTAVTVITPTASPTDKNEPSLQSGSAQRVGSFGGEAVALVAGAVGVAYMI